MTGVMSVREPELLTFVDCSFTIDAHGVRTGERGAVRVYDQGDDMARLVIMGGPYIVSVSMVASKAHRIADALADVWEAP